eukprot:TRINITY_DN6764_c0_g1_i18.p2 TRINITY_DN6764_c0_g1~~TRINITY_DN6764_c0_g1_i18.p2  ORF type:complete len:106 (+),score=20.79 TRINITY_DN6764_c0_g1_i18:1163-1480(+)
MMRLLTPIMINQIIVGMKKSERRRGMTMGNGRQGPSSHHIHKINRQTLLFLRRPRSTTTTATTTTTTGTATTSTATIAIANTTTNVRHRFPHRRYQDHMRIQIFP